MKRALLLLLTVLLICIPGAVTAAAETEQALFDVWDCSGENPVWVSAAIPAADGLLITACFNLPRGNGALAVTDGDERWEVKAVIPDSTDTIAMILYDQDGRKPKHGSWTLLPAGESVPASECTVRSAEGPGTQENFRVLSSQTLTWNHNECLLLSLSGRPAPGSPVLTADGRLAGITAAYYAEGINRVTAIGTGEISRCVTEAVRTIAKLPHWGNPEDSFEVSADGNRVTIDWAKATIPEKQEGESLYLVLMDAGNDYLNYYPAETETRKASFLLAPGRVYIAGIAKSEGTPTRLPERFAVISLPLPERLRKNGFESKVLAIAEAPESGLKEGERPVPVEEVTAELLQSGRAYFYSHSVYRVEEASDQISLLVTLTAPDGSNALYESVWLYAPEYMDEDIWYVPMKQVGLTDALERKGYPLGNYRMAFYVGGELADSFTFTLK